MGPLPVGQPETIDCTLQISNLMVQSRLDGRNVPVPEEVCRWSPASDPLYRELNAFEKSRFIRIEPSAISPRKRLAACTTHPPGTPTPTCRGDRYFTTLRTAKAMVHLAANLRQKYPITIGRLD